MPNIIRSQQDIPTASEEDLNYTFAELTGERPPLWSRSAAEVAVANAIMSAQDADGHSGIPKSSKPRALTKAELAAKVSARYQNAAAGARDVADGMRRDLLRATVPPGAERTDFNHSKEFPMGRKKQEPTAEEGASRPGRPPTPMTIKVKANPERALREGSMRHKIVELASARPGKKITLAELNEALGENVRGHVKVLIETGHAEEV